MDAQFSRVGASPEINMTPMIDIMLVLFVIFVVLARSQMGFDVTVPADGGVSSGPPIVLELPDAGGYRLNGTPVSSLALGGKLADVFSDRPTKVLFIRTGEQRRYQELIRAADIARGAGVQVVSLMPRR